MALVLVIAGVAVGAVLLFVFLRGADRVDGEVAGGPSDAATPMDAADDAAAKATIGRAVVAARTAWAETGVYPSDAEAFAAVEPSITFTPGRPQARTWWPSAATPRRSPPRSVRGPGCVGGSRLDAAASRPTAAVRRAPARPPGPPARRPGSAQPSSPTGR